MKLLALGAHPDDVEIYMFGMLLAARARGDDVVVAVATDGAAGGKTDPAELARTRRREATAAAALLDAAPVFLDFADGALVADGDLDAALKRLVGAVGPDLIITHAPNDYHGDHRALSDAVRLAAGFAAPVLFADTMMGVGFTPTHYVDISTHFTGKLAAIRAHGSQDPERFVTMVEAHNRFRAAQAGAPGQAEAYRFEPIFPFVDIRDLLPPAPPINPVRDRRTLDDGAH